MLNREDRRAIEGLFDRLREVERTAEPRDAEAEALIADEVSRQPASPYYMAQTILVQERALAIAESRIKELEDEAGRRRVPAPQRGPWDRQDRAEERGGGFLAGAAQTALGVTGGILIGSAMASMFGSGAATAAEPAPASEPQPEPVADDPGIDDGGDFGDFGGFDLGGDF
jgi:hypothetical protein